MTQNTPSADSPERDAMTATRRMSATSSAVFSVLADPARHPETEPGSWVRSAIDPQPITSVGDVFGMNMYAERAGGDYVMHNRVIAFEKDRVIAWAPGQFDDHGNLGEPWWTWRYDIAPADDRSTDVTLTYDWTDTPQFFRDQVSMPPFGPDFRQASLACLEEAALEIGGRPVTKAASRGLGRVDQEVSTSAG